MTEQILGKSLKKTLDAAVIALSGGAASSAESERGLLQLRQAGFGV